MTATPIVKVPVGVAVERRKANSPWLDAIWRPIEVLHGVPAAAPWTVIDANPAATTFYAGDTDIELFRTETANYRSNLTSGTPLLWVILRPTGGEPAFELLAVTADPAEGEALTGAGNDLVETVSMPASIRAAIESFILEHHVERPTFRRKRDRSGQAPRERSADEPEEPS
jgi:hypothetical protein